MTTTCRNITGKWGHIGHIGSKGLNISAVKLAKISGEDAVLFFYANVSPTV